MVNRLSFAPGESPEHGVHFWEPVVDGRPLRHILYGTPPNGSVEPEVLDPVPVLVHDWPVGMTDDVLVLLGERPPELASGRVPIFVCGACGDLGCGAITAAVEWTADTVVWRDFGWDVNYETEDDDDEILFAGPLVFARTQYEAELRRFVDTFRDVRASLPPRRILPSPEDRRRRSVRGWWPFT
ncbi:hypothetical protein [Cellulomonas cellasea]|uniref:Uncharacterized protein n=1 Tax=Cellulomonas cellasea TaxID=43670 RepID=A0A7W4YB36_9CELL|nr:hypothetical protein [Cellulomonas cellasea]MBB2923470.1 hypothetical protein [Cellulomonas cellasea]